MQPEDFRPATRPPEVIHTFDILIIHIDMYYLLQQAMEYASSLVIAILLGITLVTLSAEVRTKPRIIFPDLGDSVSALGSPSGSPAKWDYLRFARYWPMSFCLLSKVSRKISIYKTIFFNNL